MNNAGAGGEGGPIAETSVEGFDRTIALLLGGPFLGIKYGVPDMQNGETIINIASVAGLSSRAAYADHGHDKDGPREDHGRGDRDERQGGRQVPVVPEANAGWVLVPFFGAVLLFSARQLLRGKVTE